MWRIAVLDRKTHPTQLSDGMYVTTRQLFKLNPRGTHYRTRSTQNVHRSTCSGACTRQPIPGSEFFETWGSSWKFSKKTQEKAIVHISIDPAAEVNCFISNRAWLSIPWHIRLKLLVLWIEPMNIPRLLPFIPVGLAAAVGFANLERKAPSKVFSYIPFFLLLFQISTPWWQSKPTKTTSNLICWLGKVAEFSAGGGLVFRDTVEISSIQDPKVGSFTASVYRVSNLSLH